MSKWLLVDGYNLAFRAFYALPDLTRSDGTPTGALHGWVKSLWRLMDLERPDAMLVFFDLGGAQDRLAVHPEYKANRKETPAALEAQIPVIKQLTRAMGLVGVEQEGVESDDLLASQALRLGREGHEAIIVSADKDFAQLVSDKIQILLPPPTANPKLGWRRLDAAGVMEKFGVQPSQIAAYLALVGDTSDNIPGLTGVGPKTAATWLKAHGTLEGVIANAASLKPERFRPDVTTQADRLRMNLQLTTLRTDWPTVACERTDPQVAELLALLDANEMRTTADEARRRYVQAELF